MRKTVGLSYFGVGVWRSWLARRVWDAEVGGSSPLTPTIYKVLLQSTFLFACACMLLQTGALWHSCLKELKHRMSTE